MSEQKKPFAKPEDGLTPEQAHDLGRVARVVAADRGVSIHAAIDYCRANPSEIAALATSFGLLAAAVTKANAEKAVPTPVDLTE